MTKRLKVFPECSPAHAGALLCNEFNDALKHAMRARRPHCCFLRHFRDPAAEDCPRNLQAAHEIILLSREHCPAVKRVVRIFHTSSHRCAWSNAVDSAFISATSQMFYQLVRFGFSTPWYNRKLFSVASRSPSLIKSSFRRSSHNLIPSLNLLTHQLLMDSS